MKMFQFFTIRTKPLNCRKLQTIKGLEWSSRNPKPLLLNYEAANSIWSLVTVSSQQPGTSATYNLTKFSLNCLQIVSSLPPVGLRSRAVVVFRGPVWTHTVYIYISQTTNEWTFEVSGHVLWTNQVSGLSVKQTQSEQRVINSERSGLCGIN